MYMYKGGGDGITVPQQCNYPQYIPFLVEHVKGFYQTQNLSKILKHSKTQGRGSIYLTLYHSGSVNLLVILRVKSLFIQLGCTLILVVFGKITKK